MPHRTPLIALGLWLAGCLATDGPPIPEYDAPRTALLLMDLQRDFLADDAPLPVASHQIPGLLANVGRLSRAAAALGWEVAYVRNVFDPDGWIGNWFRNDAALAGSPGAELDPRVARVAGSEFTKDAPDAFSNPALDAWLRARRVDHLLLTGVFADQCVFWTGRGALNREYRVTIVEDAVAAADDAAQLNGVSELHDAGAKVAKTDALLGAMLPSGVKEPILPGP